MLMDPSLKGHDTLKTMHLLDRGLQQIRVLKIDRKGVGSVGVIDISGKIALMSRENRGGWYRWSNTCPPKFISWPQISIPLWRKWDGGISFSQGEWC